MTSKLEKQFFDTFGIDKRIEFEACHAIDSSYTYSTAVKRYPQITDRILLELICILTRWHLDEREPYEITSISIEQLKNQILSNSLYIAKYAKAKQLVQALFKEG